MFRKIVKHLTNNIGLKILSILIAVILWLVVVNFDDPDITRSYTVPVTVVNPEIIEDMGKVYEVKNGSEMATFFVSGKRSLMDRISSSNFKATADLSQVDFRQESDVKLVPIDVSIDWKESQFSITKKTVNMQISIEDLSTEQFVILPVTQGTPAEGYAIGEVAVAPNLIKISGPQSVVSRVSKVAVNINVEGVAADVSENVMPVMYDEADNVIASEQLRLSQDTVTVTADILGTKVVPVRCSVSGTPADGYQYTELEFAPETVTIKGEQSVLNDIHEIPIPESVINIDGATASIENTVDISPYLNGISLVDAEAGKIAIKVIIEKLDVKSLDLPTTQIKVLNLDSKYELEFATTTISVPIRGMSIDTAELTVDKLQASIDVNGLLPGVQSVNVDVVLDEKIQLTSVVTARINIKEVDTPEDNPENEDSKTPEGTGAGGDTGGNGETGKAEDTGGSGDSSGNNKEDLKDTMADPDNDKTETDKDKTEADKDKTETDKDKTETDEDKSNTGVNNLRS